MTSSRFSLSLDYLQSASRASLQSFELARLNHAAHLRKEIAALIDQWVQETSDAMLARWMLDHHHSLQPCPISPAEVVQSIVNPGSSLLPDPQPSATAPTTQTGKSPKFIIPAQIPVSSSAAVKAPPRSVRPTTAPATSTPSKINAYHLHPIPSRQSAPKSA